MAVARDAFSFQNMTRCQTPGCDWNVVIPRMHCRRHALPMEPKPSYEYAEGTLGEIHTRGFDLDVLVDCE